MKVEMKDQKSQLLTKMMRRMTLSYNKLPPDIETWQLFIDSINNLIKDYEQDRYLLERSMELSSKEMRDLYEQFEVAQSIASIGYWSYDKEENTILWSKETYNIFGLDTSQPVPTFNEIMEYIYEEDRAKILKLTERAFNEGLGYEAEFRIYYLPDKQGRWVYVKAHPEFKKNVNDVIKYILSGVIMDITARKQSENDLKHLNQKLVEMSRLTGMSEIATSVLHNIGNVLNSVNISVVLLQNAITNSEIDKLIKISELMSKKIQTEPNFLTTDEKGKLIPDYLCYLAKKLSDEHEHINTEITSLQKNIQHIKDIVLMQKEISGISGTTEIVNLLELIDTAIKIGCDASEKLGINIYKKYEHDFYININKSKLMQILINLVRNAKDALIEESDNNNKKIIIEIKKNPNTSCIEVIIEDNGVGILNKNLNKIFSMGFTSKVNGHGFGLHSSALAAKEFKGNLLVKSDGEGKGAQFILEIPGYLEAEYDGQS